MKNAFLGLLLACLAGCGKSIETSYERQPVKYLVKFYSTNAVVSTKVINVRVGTEVLGRLIYSMSPDCNVTTFCSISLKAGAYVADYLDPSNQYANKQVSFVVPDNVTNCIFFDLH